MINNERIRHIIDTITSKVVLILGRFTPERKAVLDALREELRKRDYLPVLFDFERPAGQTMGVASSRMTFPASRSFSAATSRSRSERSRASFEAVAACANIVVATASNRSMTSSPAVASSVRMNASSVAVRLSSGSRATACALAAAAKRASVATLPGGRRSTCGRPAASARISSRRASARPISAPLWMYGPRTTSAARAARPLPAPAARRGRGPG